MNIFIWANLDDESIALLKASPYADQCYFANHNDISGSRAEFEKAEVVFGNIPADWLHEPQPNLRWIQLESVGFAQYADVPTKDDFVMTHLKGFFAEPVAETAVANILALYRKLDALFVAQHEQAWRWSELRPQLRLLQHAKVLILGGGGIGLRVKKLLSGFECDVTVYSKTTPEADIYSLEEMEQALKTTDIVVGCLPHSPETAGLLSRKRLEMMKSDAILINVGRGSLVDEAALIEALNEGRLSGAGLDVTVDEPLPKGHPLWNTPNVLLTQHTSGGFREERRNKTRLFLDNLEQYKAGKTLQHIVNFERGY